MPGYAHYKTTNRPGFTCFSLDSPHVFVMQTSCKGKAQEAFDMRHL